MQFWRWGCNTHASRDTRVETFPVRHPQPVYLSPSGGLSGSVPLTMAPNSPGTPEIAPSTRRRACLAAATKNIRVRGVDRGAPFRLCKQRRRTSDAGEEAHEGARRATFRVEGSACFATTATLSTKRGKAGPRVGAHACSLARSLAGAEGPVRPTRSSRRSRHVRRA